MLNGVQSGGTEGKSEQSSFVSKKPFESSKQHTQRALLAIAMFSMLGSCFFLGTVDARADDALESELKVPLGFIRARIIAMQ